MYLFRTPNSILLYKCKPVLKRADFTKSMEKWNETVDTDDISLVRYSKREFMKKGKKTKDGKWTSPPETVFIVMFQE